MKLAALACIAAATLCGCVDTVFESLPGKNISQCDQRFVGKWRLTNSGKNSRDDEKLFIVIEPDCKALHLFENGKDDVETDAKTHLAFASVGAKSILAVRFDEEQSHADKTDWSQGYHHFLYDLRKGAIRLHPVDDTRVAHLIIDGKIRGRTEKISKRPGERSPGNGASLHNYVACDADAMVQAVELHGMFAEAASIILKPATDTEISASAKPAPASK